MERVECVEDLNLLGFRAQGIVGVDAIIPTSIASSRPAVCRRITNVGFDHGTPSFFQ